VSFYYWINVARKTNDPIGDFIGDARDDPNFPLNIRSLKALTSYASRHGACQECIDTLPDVWRRYVKWMHSRSAGPMKFDG
jgi:uncharacterized protein YozE (UPF0346 family)